MLKYQLGLAASKGEPDGIRMETRQTMPKHFSPLRLLCNGSFLYKGLTAGLVAVILVTGGCGLLGNSGAVDAKNSSPEWLCEAGKAADDWDCIQSEDISPQLAEYAEQAKAAEAARAAEANAPVNNAIQQPAGPQLLQDSAPRLPTAISRPIDPAPGLPTTRGPGTQPEVPNPSAPVPAGPEATETTVENQSSAVAPTRSQAPLRTAAAPQRAQASEQEPAYARLAYRPTEPVRIIDLPENFYAAQLLAVSTKQQIENFVVAEDLYNMSAARIEREGQILYVLLLGVYESKAIAQQAVAAMPDAVRTLKPWVRAIDGLQEAMTRADRLAATADIRQP